MDVFIQKMRFRQDRRKCLVVEEAWKAIASPLMAGYLLYLYKTVRKFWGEAIVVTQELGDIIGNAVVKDSIINNSDTIILLDQTKFKDNYKEIAALLSINETERKKIFTINQLDNKEGRDFFKEFYIGRGGVGEVYGNEVAKEQYLTYSTEKPEKSAVEIYTKNHHSYTAGLDAFMLDMKKSGLSLGEFVKKVNMKKSILFIALSFWLLTCRAQEVVVDPTTSAAIAVNSAVINGQLKTTNNNLSLIQKGQLAVTGQLVIVNNMQSKIYAGLTQVAFVINNLTSIKEIGQCGSDIINDVQLSLLLAKSDPVLLLFAEQGARDFETRAVTLGTDVSAFVLKGGGSNLMDAGERGKLLNHIETEMQILRGIAYGMQRAMYWAKINGIWASLNPWAEWKNRDVQIANDVVNNDKYLKQ